MRLAADENGRVLGADLTLTMDCGAYFSRVTPIIPALTGVMMTGVYDIPKVRARATGVFTNKVMSEPYRGAGRPEAAYFLERAMDLLADELELDPVELPAIQEDLVQRCRSLGVPSIVATGLLRAMQDSPRPSRAEVCDVAAAVRQGADSLMLSDETSNSRHPVEATATLAALLETYRP